MSGNVYEFILTLKDGSVTRRSVFKESQFAAEQYLRRLCDFEKIELYAVCEDRRKSGRGKEAVTC